MFRNLIFFLSFLFQYKKKKLIRFFQFHQKSVKWFKRRQPSPPRTTILASIRIVSHIRLTGQVTIHIYIYTVKCSLRQGHTRNLNIGTKVLYIAEDIGTDYFSSGDYCLSLSLKHIHTHIRMCVGSCVDVCS